MGVKRGSISSDACCPAGSYWIAVAGGCTDCEAGQYRAQNDTVFSGCKLCAGGQYANVSGRPRANPAPWGAWPGTAGPTCALRVFPGGTKTKPVRPRASNAPRASLKTPPVPPLATSAIPTALPTRRRKQSATRARPERRRSREARRASRAALANSETSPALGARSAGQGSSAKTRHQAQTSLLAICAPADGTSLNRRRVFASRAPPANTKTSRAKPGVYGAQPADSTSS